MPAPYIPPDIIALLAIGAPAPFAKPQTFTVKKVTWDKMPDFDKALLPEAAQEGYERYKKVYPNNEVYIIRDKKTDKLIAYVMPADAKLSTGTKLITSTAGPRNVSISDTDITLEDKSRIPIIRQSKDTTTSVSLINRGKLKVDVSGHTKAKGSTEMIAEGGDGNLDILFGSKTQSMSFWNATDSNQKSTVTIPNSALTGLVVGSVDYVKFGDDNGVKFLSPLKDFKPVMTLTAAGKSIPLQDDKSVPRPPEDVVNDLKAARAAAEKAPPMPPRKGKTP